MENREIYSFGFVLEARQMSFDIATYRVSLPEAISDEKLIYIVDRGAVKLRERNFRDSLMKPDLVVSCLMDLSNFLKCARDNYPNESKHKTIDR